jgi:methylated-DNA-[protein]-cysteine S-methyltransferase
MSVVRPSLGVVASSASTTLTWATLDSPVGPLSAGCTPAGLSQVRFGPPPRTASSAPAASPAVAPTSQLAATAVTGAAHDLSRTVVSQLGDYFAGSRRIFDVPIDWTALSGLRRQVLQVLFDTVGYGQTVSYGALADRAGLTGHDTALPARAVGQVMGSNPIPLVVPCHRVVAADGLGGYSGGTGPEVKRWLLTFEGALPPTLDWEPARLNA